MKTNTIRRTLAGLCAFAVVLGTAAVLPCSDGPAGAAFSVSAEVLAEGGFEYTLSDGGAVIVGCTSSETDLVIPEKLGGKTVTNVAKDAFAGCGVFGRVTVPGTIKRLTHAGFGSLRAESIEIGEGTEIIDGCCFVCEELTEITVPESVTEIGERAFGYHVEFGTDRYDYSYYENSSFTVYGYMGSAAEAYAVDNGFVFSPLDERGEAVFGIASAEAEAGKEVTVDVTLSECRDIASFRVAVGYDSDVMKLTAVETGSIPGSSESIVTGPVSEDPLVLLWCDMGMGGYSSGEGETVTVASLTFEIDSDAPADDHSLSITLLDEDDLFDSKLHNINYSLEGGWITVKEPVKEKKLEGTVTLKAGKGGDAAAASITLENEDGTVTAVPDKDGSFTLENVKAGEYTITVRNKGFVPYTAEITVGGEEPAALDITMQLYGDVDGDGAVNMKDYGRLQKYLNNNTTKIEAAPADMNSDGKLNMRDYTALQKYLNGWEIELDD